MITISPEQKTQHSSVSEQANQDSFQTSLSIIEHDFPMEFLIAGELAQLETYAIPSISKLLHRTGQYEKEGLKRLDDTRATMYGIFLHHKDSEERQQMVEHLNWVHGHYDIANEDSLYTILRMFFHPIEWIQRWGWRKLSEDEIDAMTREMVHIGKAMDIEFETESFDELYLWQKHYREQKQQYSPTNEAVTLGTIQGIKDHFPRWLHPVIPGLVKSFLHDEDLMKALGLKPANTLQRGLAYTPLLIWKYLSKLYRPWRRTAFSSGWLANYYPSYENNRVDYSRLGPTKLIQHRNKKSGCPFH